jgi:hypothetical protein
MILLTLLKFGRAIGLFRLLTEIEYRVKSAEGKRLASLLWWMYAIVDRLALQR